MIIRSEFSGHLLNAKGIENAKLIAEGFSTLLNNIESICGSGSREMSIVKTKLEEASFFAKKAMAVRSEYQSGV